MNKTLISAGLAFSIVVAGLAPAIAQVNEPSVPVPAPARATATYELKNHEFDDYAYTYRLSNGQVAEFTEQNNRYYVVLRDPSASPAVQAINASRARPVQLLAVAPGQFVTQAGVEMRFANEGDLVTISNFERLPAAKVAMAEAGKPMVAFR